MKVEMYSKYPDAGVSMRVLETTCPQCKKWVRFALLDDECLKEEIKWYKERVGRLEKELVEQKMVIHKLIGLKE